MRPPIAVLLVLWLLAAWVAVTTGLLLRVPPPVVAVLLAAVATLVCLAVPGFRRWMQCADLRLFLLPHLVRFVGLVFLILVSNGVLAPAFRPIGWGDLLAAIGAVGLLALGAPERRSSYQWWIWLAWNTFGVVDMALLVVTGIRLALAAPEQFALFRQFPFGLLPTFAVPLIITTHVLIYVRLLAAHSASSEVPHA